MAWSVREEHIFSTWQILDSWSLLCSEIAYLSLNFRIQIKEESFAEAVQNKLQSLQQPLQICISDLGQCAQLQDMMLKILWKKILL